MRIAISGTHCCGKSTLIDEFLLAHHGYAHEPEPYETLQEEYGEMFGAKICADDFYRQLEYNVGQLRRYRSGDGVIFEQSPADFLAYMFALAKLDRDPEAERVIKNSLAIAQNGFSFLDVVVFLPGNDLYTEAPESEDPELRNEMDSLLEGILIDDEFGWFGSNRPLVLKASGATAQRLETIEGALRSQAMVNFN
jgi:hypothetical protein